MGLDLCSVEPKISAMRFVLFLLMAAGPLWAVEPPAPPVQKLKVVMHDTPRCIVTRSNIAGGRPKFELVYVEGSVEHHIFVANRAAAQIFFKNPPVYMERLRQMEAAYKK